MTDLLDELRALDPVDRDALEVPAALEARVLAGRPSRLGRRAVASVVAVALTGAAAALVVAGIGGGGLPLAERAYAAVSGAGVAHWTATTRSFRDGRSTFVQKTEGWERGSVVHVRSSTGGLQQEIRSDGRHSEAWSTTLGQLSGLPPLVDQPGQPPTGDPLAAFRRAYRARSLEDLGGGRFRVRPSGPAGRRQRESITYTVDRRTGRPRTLLVETRVAASHGSTLQHGAHVYRSLTTFDSYVRLPDTAANRALLEMRPHPPAAVTDPRTLFSALRNGPRLTATQRRLAKPLVHAERVPGGPKHLSLADARGAGSGVVLIPGDETLCAMVGGGGTCSRVELIERSGLAFGGSRVDGMLVVVPDGVRAVRGRLPRHTWKTFAVHANVAVLPNGGYHFRLVR